MRCLTSQWSSVIPKHQVAAHFLATCIHPLYSLWKKNILDRRVTWSNVKHGIKAVPEDSSTGIIIVISKLKKMHLMDLQYFITEVTPLVSGITRGLKDFGSVSFQIDYLMIDIITLISNVIGLYRFSSISRFTRSILKFQKLRGLVEVTQKIYNSSTLSQWAWSFMSWWLGLNLCKHQLKAAWRFVLCKSAMAVSIEFHTNCIADWGKIKII